jgi:tetratricopeptide (TPR) repeat protein
MGVRRGSLVFCFCVLLILLASARAMSADTDDVSTAERKATTAFALGRYAEAADNFEKAFELRPDAALLYNAAQAHRLAGNKERALSLYENYLRVYGKREKREEVETRIAELKQAIEHDRVVATSPPTGTEPVGAAVAVSAPPPASGPGSAPAVTLPAAPRPDPASAPPMLVNQPARAQEDDNSIMRKAWFWAVVGGGVVVAVVVGVLLATGGAKDPSPSLGKLDGN